MKLASLISPLARRINFRVMVGASPRRGVLVTTLAAGLFGVMGLRILDSIRQFVVEEQEASASSVPRRPLRPVDQSSADVRSGPNHV